MTGENLGKFYRFHSTLVLIQMFYVNSPHPSEIFFYFRTKFVKSFDSPQPITHNGVLRLFMRPVPAGWSVRPEVGCQQWLRRRGGMECTLSGFWSVTLAIKGGILMLFDRPLETGKCRSPWEVLHKGRCALQTSPLAGRLPTTELCDARRPCPQPGWLASCPGRRPGADWPTVSLGIRQSIARNSGI